MWVDNIKMDVGDTGWSGVDSNCEFSNEPSGSKKCWKLSSSFTTGGLSSSVHSSIFS
jgi:hypothetical protein